MKILVHDYSGHPFQAQLSRELAQRGHDVEHVHNASYVSGKGRLNLMPGDPSTLRFTSLEMSGSFDKYSIRRRMNQEVAYARAFDRQVSSSTPDVVVMCNVPLLAHAIAQRRLRRRGIPTVFWHQDVYSHAIGAVARHRFGPLGPPLARVANHLERGIARNSDAVVAISDDFVPVHDRWGTPRDNVHVIPNWGPVDEIVPRSRANAWARAHGLVDVPVLLYSGTLGLKHKPSRLAELLRGVRERLPGAQLVVVSEGDGARRLSRLDEPGLTVLPFQPFDTLPDVLASGDVLVTILEAEASEYSVPSKTLSYLCAGRPVVALLPESNPAYGIVRDSGGRAFDTTVVDIATISEQVAALLSDADDLADRGRQARAYAEASFDIDTVASRFEQVLVAAAGGQARDESSVHDLTVVAQP